MNTKKKIKRLEHLEASIGRSVLRGADPELTINTYRKYCKKATDELYLEIDRLEAKIRAIMFDADHYADGSIDDESYERVMKVEEKMELLKFRIAEGRKHHE